MTIRIQGVREMRILLVEDDVRLNQAVCKILIDNGYEVDSASDGISGMDKSLNGSYDVIILDVMLPGIDGFGIVKKIRQENIATPVLMLTAKAQIADKIEGLDAGADDYMAKPFAPAELLAHLRALLRRTGGQISKNDEYSFNGLVLNISSHDLSYVDKTINLSLKEYQIMEQFLRDPGHVISKEEMLAKVWGEDNDGGDNNVEAYISIVRKKLKYLKTPVSIETIRKVGYRLVVEE